MISFVHITKSIYYIRGTSKQKATLERILNFLKKKNQYRNLPAADLEQEINTLVTTGLYLKMIKTHFSSEVRQIHQQKIKKMNLMASTTILKMKQVKIKVFLHRPRRM